MTAHLAIGGLIAVGLDASGRYLLVVSQAGRGVFAVDNWERVARDPTVVHLQDEVAIGIGPIDGERIPVQSLDPKTDALRFTSTDGKVSLYYESGTLTVNECAQKPAQPWWKFWT